MPRPPAWTKDANGEYVRWNEPPHYVGGVVNLRLEGEDPVSDVELAKRRREYLQLQIRRLKRRNNNGPAR